MGEPICQTSRRLRRYRARNPAFRGQPWSPFRRRWSVAGIDALLQSEHRRGRPVSAQPAVRSSGPNSEAALERAWAPWQSPRNPSELLADLQAQVAANQAGVLGLQNLVNRCGQIVVQQQMAALQRDAAAVCVGCFIVSSTSSAWMTGLSCSSRLWWTAISSASALISRAHRRSIPATSTPRWR